MNIIVSRFAVGSHLNNNQQKKVTEKVNELPGVLQCKFNDDAKSFNVTFDDDLCSEEEINQVLRHQSMKLKEGAEFGFISYLVILALFLLLFLLNKNYLRVEGQDIIILVVAAVCGIFSPFYRIRYNQEFRDLSNISQKLFTDLRTSRSILFILGRVTAFTALGFFWGALGSLLRVMGPLYPIVQIFCGAVMVFLGLYMMGVKQFSVFHKYLPIFLRIRYADSDYLFITGLKSAFIPGIIPQGLQLFAFGYGDPRITTLLFLIFILASIPFMLSYDVIKNNISAQVVNHSSLATGGFMIILAIILLLVPFLT